IYLELKSNTRNDSAIHYAQLADKYNNLIRNDSLKYLDNKMFIYGNLSNAYFNLQLHDSAIIYNDKCLRVAEKIGRLDYAATSLHANAIIFLLQKNYDKSIEYFFKAIELFEKLGMQGFVFKAKSDLATAYYSKGDLVNSRKFVNESQEFSILNKDSSTLVQNYSTIGLIYLQDQQYQKAIDNFEMGLKICEKKKNPINEKQLWKNCGEAFAKIHNYDKAIFMFEKTLILSVGDYKTTYECYESLSRIYADKSNYKRAFNYMNDAQDLKEIIFDSAKSQIINDLTLKYETDKINQEIVILNKDNKIQKAEFAAERADKNSLITGITIFILFSILGFIFYKRRRDAVVKKKEAELKAHITEVEMKALRAQMNPHFIFNCLKSINEYIQTNKTTLASDYLIRFSKLIRAILEHSRKKEILISEEIETLELYIQLESFRLEFPLNYKIIIDDQIDINNVLIPPMLFQPIIENSIWHGLSPKNTSGMIIIRILKNKEQLICEVEDNGVGRQFSNEKKVSNTEIKKGSLGIKITEERLAIIEQTKLIKTNLTFEDLSQNKGITGLKVTFNLPLEYYV
ncbi:MAG: tetratricopeptide repeat protein, partial [bacterium]